MYTDLRITVNADRIIHLRKIPLNKKYKISPKKSFQCTVLSQEASNMIKDYVNKSLLTQRNANKEPIKKLNMYF